jgi:hypothetical protein
VSESNAPGQLSEAASKQPWPPAWFGMIDDSAIPTDLSENLDKYLEGFGADSL